MSERCSKIGREAYTLLDKPFFYLLGRVSDALEASGIGYALYGGCGWRHIKRDRQESTPCTKNGKES